MCLAQGHNAVTLVRLEPVTPRSQVKHSSIKPLCSRANLWSEPSSTSLLCVWEERLHQLVFSDQICYKYQTVMEWPLYSFRSAPLNLRQASRYKCDFNRRALGPWIPHLNPGTWVDDVLACGQKWYDLKIFLFLALVAMLFSQTERLINFGRGHLEVHFGKIILNKDQEMLLKDIFLEVWQPLFQRSRTICAILVEGIWRYIWHWNRFEFEPVVQEKMLKDICHVEHWRPLCLAERNHLRNFGRGQF